MIPTKECQPGKSHLLMWCDVPVSLMLWWIIQTISLNHTIKIWSLKLKSEVCHWKSFRDRNEGKWDVPNFSSIYRLKSLIGTLLNLVILRNRNTFLPRTWRSERSEKSEMIHYNICRYCIFNPDAQARPALILFHKTFWRLVKVWPLAWVDRLFKSKCEWKPVMQWDLGLVTQLDTLLRFLWDKLNEAQDETHSLLFPLSDGAETLKNLLMLIWKS